MLSASDSFIEYLSSELTPFGVPVFWWRQSEIADHSGVLKQDALNVKILGFWENGSEEMCLISLDLLAKDDRTVLTNLKAVRDVLLAIQFIPELDYDAGGTPTGRSVSWDARKVRFLSVRTPAGARYAHYNATFPLTYTRE